MSDDATIADKIEDLRLAASNHAVRLEHKDRQDAEQDLSIKALKAEVDASKRPDWKLYLTILLAVCGGIASAWAFVANHLDNELEEIRNERTAEVTRLEARIDALAKDIAAETAAREAMDAKHDAELTVRQGWMDEINRANARSEVRDEQVRDALAEFRTDRHTARDQAGYAALVDLRFADMARAIGELRAQLEELSRVHTVRGETP